MKLAVIAAPGHESLARNLGTALGADQPLLEARRFPDGERYLRLRSDLTGASVVVAASLRDPDPQLATLLFLADLARDLGAARVGLAAPYLAYLRQDRRFNDGEALTSRSFASVVSGKFDWIATIDPHLHRYSSLDAVYSIPSVVAHAASDLSNWIRHHVPDAAVIGPDEESAQWAEQVARDAGVASTVLRKTRHGDRDVDIHVASIEVLQGRTPVLVDDIVSSAQTMARAAERLQALGAAAPVCVGVHAVFADGAAEALARAGVARVVTTNTIAHATNEIDVVPSFAEALRPLALPP